MVGPNGSGKSNVVDAVAWVLGAQGAKALRGAKMDDVIFAGTASKAALGRAEVTLTIDNASGRLPLEMSEVSIRRTLFRNGDSEYAINGAPCRLLDVQELLSDAGVGRTQHVIVSQGQLGAVLEGRPEDRRAAIEEAAGILKFRKRREKAERRLEATGADLVRLVDLNKEARRQMRPLTRQAEASRRHGALAAELSALRLHLGLLEADERAKAAEAAREALVAAEADKAHWAAELARLDTALSELAPEEAAAGSDLGGSDLRRAEAALAKVVGLARVLGEKERSFHKASLATIDEGLIEALGAERDSVAQELEAVDAEAAELLPEFAELERHEAALAEERRALDARTQAVGSEAAREELASHERELAQAKASLTALGVGVERDTAELERLEGEWGVASAALESVSDRIAERSLAEVESAAQVARGEMEAAELALAQAEADLAAANDVLTLALGERRATEARVEALGFALEEVRKRAGSGDLADMAGVAGNLFDLVVVEEGMEDAFVAAAGDAFFATVATDREAAEGLLAAMAERHKQITVVVTGGSEVHDRGLAPRRCSWMADHVQVQGDTHRALLGRLMDKVVVSQGDWQEALEVHLAQPGLTVVTRQGDRFDLQGWKVGAKAPGVTAGALAEAEAHLAAARAAEERARAGVEACRESVKVHRVALGEARAALGGAESALAKATAESDRLEGEQRRLERAVEALAGRVAATMARRSADQEAMSAAEAGLVGLERLCVEASDRARKADDAGRELQAVRADWDARSAAARALRHDLEVRAAGFEERRRMLGRRLEGLGSQVSALEGDSKRLASQRVEAAAAVVACRRLGARMAELDAQARGVVGRLGALHDRERERASAIGQRLADLRRERSGAERSYQAAAEAANRAGLDHAQARTRAEAAEEVLRREFGVGPDEAASVPMPDLPEGVELSGRADEVAAELARLGPVNPLAAEELAELEERAGFLEEQLRDVEDARRELDKVIQAIDEEITAVFSSAWEDVAKNFSELIAAVFPGGSGRLELTDPTDMLTTGVEITARPAGKQVRKLSLLSGGERSLVALSFLFALFRSRPSPFYIMDEVEAALDDVNLGRFLSLVQELRPQAQLLIVTHQKRTMESADCLYGVTMQPGGASKVVSERLRAPEGAGTLA